jgi:UDP-N-acetylglucosamine:LPS N-acetylglucosamine transferase
MKRNGLVFVPREPPKRVILYPTQDSANQQQQPNALFARAKTALVTNNHNETVQQPNNNIRLSQQHPLSSPPNGTTKLTEKSGNNLRQSFSILF